MAILLCLIGFAVGMGLSFQTSINGRLRRSVGSPFLTSLISFAISTVFILVLALFAVDETLPGAAVFASEPWWIWLGGVFGLTFLTGNILLFPKLGAVQTVIFPVLGQILAGLVIDQFGLFHAPVSPTGIVKATGTLLVLAGVSGVVWFSGKRGSALGRTDEKSHALWLWRVLGIITGACSAFQITINGQLGLVLGSSLRAALVSFIVGTTSLFLIVCVQRPRISVRVPEGSVQNPWWMWTGGSLGALYVIGNASIGPQIGTGTTVVVGLLGLMTAGLIVDQTGILQSARKPVSWRQILCLLAMFLGVCIIRIFA